MEAESSEVVSVQVFWEGHKGQLAGHKIQNGANFWAFCRHVALQFKSPATFQVNEKVNKKVNNNSVRYPKIA